MRAWEAWALGGALVFALLAFGAALGWLPPWDALGAGIVLAALCAVLACATRRDE